jgi:hypothetical protein
MRSSSEDATFALGQKGYSVQLMMLLSNRTGIPLSSRAAIPPLPPIIARVPALWLALYWSLTCLSQNGKCFDPSYPAIALPSLDPLPSSTIFPPPHSLQSAQLLCKPPPESPFVHSHPRWPAKTCKWQPANASSSNFELTTASPQLLQDYLGGPRPRCPRQEHQRCQG